jgi:hypothetical protein
VIIVTAPVGLRLMACLVMPLTFSSELARVGLHCQGVDGPDDLRIAVAAIASTTSRNNAKQFNK